MIIPICFSSTAYQSNQCRSLVPYVGRHTQRITINIHLKQYLEQNENIHISTNSCRTVVPYVKRVSLLEDILRRVDSSLLPAAQVDNDVIDVERSSFQAVCQTTTLSWNGEDVNFADLESCYDESSGLYYTADTDFHGIHDDSDQLTLTQCTPPDSQHMYAQQAMAQNENEELMTDLEELRAALSDEIQPDTSEDNCSAVVLYNPPVSLWDQEKHEHLLKEMAPMAMYRPIRSFWDQREFRMRLYQAERKRQIIRNQRNKCHRFLPYDKDDRKWCKETPPAERATIPSSSIMQSTKGMPTNEGSMALIPYSGNSILDAIRESKSFLKPTSVVMCSELVEYLTFCRNVTCQSTSSQGKGSPKRQRGVKRRCENISHIRVVMKKWKGSESNTDPKTVLGERNQ